MLGLIQRVSSADVVVEGDSVGAISSGLLLLLGVQKGDTQANGEKLLSRILNYRVFGDDKGHMNLSLLDVKGELLVVSQFTLAADTHKGLRPSFSSAAPPELAEHLFKAGFRLTRMEEEQVNLETAFMRLTKGLVQ